MKTFGSAIALVLMLATFSALPASASISYTCAGNIDSTLANTCTNILNGTISGIYSSTFRDTSLGTVKIYIQYGVTNLAASLQYFTNATYTAYADALAAHEGDANDITAVASLGGDTTNPVVAGDGVALTSALASSLGLTAEAGSLGIDFLSHNPCTLGSAGCYNGIVTLTNAANTWYYRSGGQPSGTYDFYSAVQHETDEILGTPSCITGSGNNPATITTSVNCTNHPVPGNPITGVSAPDLFRYTTTPGTRSYLGSANGSIACFSINGGVTDTACYNNQPNGSDYGDWDSTSLRVQNAFGTPTTSGTDITNDTNLAEIRVLDAIGYNLPEPATMGLLGASLAALAFAQFRRRRSQKFTT